MLLTMMCDHYCFEPYFEHRYEPLTRIYGKYVVNFVIMMQSSSVVSDSEPGHLCTDYLQIGDAEGHLCTYSLQTGDAERAAPIVPVQRREHKKVVDEST